MWRKVSKNIFSLAQFEKAKRKRREAKLRVTKILVAARFKYLN